jgi:hypothetical protein
MSDSEGSDRSGRARSGRARSGRAHSAHSSRSSRASSPSPSSASSLESFDSFHSDDSLTDRRLPQKPSTIARQHKKYMEKKRHVGSKPTPVPLFKKVPRVVYSINFTENTITHIGKQNNRTVKQINDSAREAFQSMIESMTLFGNIAYLVNEDNVNLENIDNIFKGLLPKGGSRRRRPSRKYKKSKRVLRKKSRSTRRR